MSSDIEQILNYEVSAFTNLLTLQKMKMLALITNYDGWLQIGFNLTRGLEERDQAKG